jgi:hypothetical protein
MAYSILFSRVKSLIMNETKSKKSSLKGKKFSNIYKVSGRVKKRDWKSASLQSIIKNFKSDILTLTLPTGRQCCQLKEVEREFKMSRNCYV